MRSVSLSFARDGQRGVVVVEGPDAAGKGGAVRRLTAEMDPRHYAVWPIGPPSAEDAMHHYLWRFWQRLPARGQIGIFDRSWYGRVLVERVEELTPEARWRQAFEELGTFERSLARDGVRIVKLHFHVSQDEQQKRLLERVHDPFKHWKISTADIQAFAKREQYEEAATEMLQRTGSEEAPCM